MKQTSLEADMSGKSCKGRGWRLKRTQQCPKCPWRKVTDPRTIPGYVESMHRGLENTIARRAELSAAPGMHVMVCHESADALCVGWVSQQCGPGNNVPLRLRMLSCENRAALELLGEQHDRFEDTLPRTETES